MNNLLKVVGLGVFILIVYTIYNNRLTPEELIEKKRIEDSISTQNKKVLDSLFDLKINESLKKIREDKKSNSSTPKSNSPSSKSNSSRSKSNNQIQTHLINNEIKVKDAYINPSGVLYVQVIDDGTNRNMYASYLCDEVDYFSPNNSINMVRVMKVNTFNHPDKFNAYGIRLGEYRCN